MTLKTRDLKALIQQKNMEIEILKYQLIQYKGRI